MKLSVLIFSLVHGNFVENPLFWGNSSKYVQPFIINVNNSQHTSIFATQILSNYTVQCSTFTNYYFDNQNVSVLMTYFSDYYDSFDVLRNQQIYCNHRYPIVFISWHNSKFVMLKPLIYSQTPQQVIDATLDSVFMRGDLSFLKTRKGTLEYPLQYVYHDLTPCVDGALLYEEAVGVNSISVCQKIALQNMNVKTTICNANIYDFDTLDVYKTTIEEFTKGLYFPIFVADTTLIKMICPIACENTVNACNPSPPPPSPPPPIVIKQLYCDYVYDLSFGWNSIAFIGDETTYYTNVRYIYYGNQIFEYYNDFTIIANINDFQYIPSSFTTTNNSFHLYVNNTNGTVVTTNCTRNVPTTCTQEVQINVGSTQFGIRSNSSMDPNNIQFYQTPAYGDVISNNDMDDFQFFVYTNRWENMTALNLLLPYVGYNYETTQDNTFIMMIC